MYVSVLGRRDLEEVAPGRRVKRFAGRFRVGRGSLRHGHARKEEEQGVRGLRAQEEQSIRLVRVLAQDRDAAMLNSRRVNGASAQLGVARLRRERASRVDHDRSPVHNASLAPIIAFGPFNFISDCEADIYRGLSALSFRFT